MQCDVVQMIHYLDFGEGGEIFELKPAGESEQET